MRSAEHGALALGPNGTHRLEDGHVEGDDPLAAFSPTAPAHLLRTDGFAHVADIMVGSFYDAELDEGCAFEELICFHGGLGGPQTRPFLLYPPTLELPPGPIVGAAAVHGVLRGWRHTLQGHAPAPRRVSAFPHPERLSRRRRRPATTWPGRRTRAGTSGRTRARRTRAGGRRIRASSSVDTRSTDSSGWARVSAARDVEAALAPQADVEQDGVGSEPLDHVATPSSHSPLPRRPCTRGSAAGRGPRAGRRGDRRR